MEDGSMVPSHGSTCPFWEPCKLMKWGQHWYHLIYGPEIVWEEIFDTHITFCRTGFCGMQNMVGMQNFVFNHWL